MAGHWQADARTLPRQTSNAGRAAPRSIGERVTSLHTPVRIGRSHSQAIVRATRYRSSLEETAMSPSFCNNKPAARAKGAAGMLWLFAITTTLVLALAGFVGIVF